MAVTTTLVELTETNFEQEVLNEKGKVLVDFWAPWCGPCRMQTPILERLAQNGVNAKIAKLNTDKVQSIARKYGITSIPTMIIFENGQEADRMIGVQPEETLKSKLK
ncbi:MAG: thioredoxin [Spirochaetota bacterium]